MKNKRKWLPLASYEFDGMDYIVFAKMRKSGLVVFKTRKITRPGTLTHGKFTPFLPINIQVQWSLIIKSGVQ